jgi:hypothetical protein
MRNTSIIKLWRFISPIVSIKNIPNEITPMFAMKLVSDLQITKLIAENHDIKKNIILQFAITSFKGKTFLFHMVMGILIT